MTDKIFIDTNILLYLSIKDEAKTGVLTNLIYKQKQATISTQVLGEFSNVIYRKQLLSPDKLIDYLNIYSSEFEVVNIVSDTIINSIRIKEKYKFSFWDSMIISSAIEANCTILYSEDMHHKQLIENKITIVNPFK